MCLSRANVVGILMPSQLYTSRAGLSLPHKPWNGGAVMPITPLIPLECAALAFTMAMR